MENKDSPGFIPAWLSVPPVVSQPVVQLQESQVIQLAADGSVPEFPEGSAKGSQLLLSASFLTAELALLQKSLDVNLKDKRVSHHCTPLLCFWSDRLCLPAVPGNDTGVRCRTSTGDVGLFGASMAPACHSLLCSSDLCLLIWTADCPYNQPFSDPPPLFQKS